jgi:hypothetical protein
MKLIGKSLIRVDWLLGLIEAQIEHVTASVSGLSLGMPRAASGSAGMLWSYLTSSQVQHRSVIVRQNDRTGQWSR